MLKYCQFIRRREGLSGAEFRAAFEQYRVLLRPVAEALGATAVRASVGLEVGRNEAIMAARGTEQPFDAMLDFYAPELAQAPARIPPEHLDPVLHFQREWFDLPRCTFFIAEEL